jgi:molybdenum cofactor cytidylyltransferase
LISAIVLAAGLSSRMGRPKMTLPWGNTTVLGQVLQVLSASGLDEILVVTGGAHEAVEAICDPAGVRTVHNREYTTGEMLSSLQLGLLSVSPGTDTAMIVLGDQPGIQEQVVAALVRSYKDTGISLIMPSFQRRRGHPWLVARELWPRLLEMRPPETPRDFLNRRSGVIHYVAVNTPSIVEDIDNPEEYLKSKP